jgi:dCMP deaminase
MSRWDHHGLAEAELVSRMSKDPSTKVGAYIADNKNRPISKGFNGPPRGITDAKWQNADRDIKLAATIHAEANAILFAERDRLEGATLYITHPPCGQCAALIAQTGIKRVVYHHADDAFVGRWGTIGAEILRDAGVEVEAI